MSRKTVKWLVSVCVILGLILAACGLYLGDHYPADTDSIRAFLPEQTVEISQLDSGDLVCLPEDPVAGLIFYPGGKVDHSAYEPLMKALAVRGVLCVVTQMPFRLAVLDVSAAAGIPEQYPQVERWYIGGHSLGGSMAASYLADHTDCFAGLVLLGSYSTADLSQSGLAVLSVYGSEDQVMNREKYEQYRDNLPEETEEVILAGGCHAGFGMYGPQEGDGAPTMTNEEQILATAEAILTMIEP